MNDLRNKRRSENYNALRAAGFSGGFATRFKDFARADVSTLCELKKQNDNVLVLQVQALTGVRVDARAL